MNNQNPEFPSSFIPHPSSFRIAWIMPGFQSNAKDRCIPALTDLAHRIATEHDLTVFALQYPGKEDVYQIGNVKIRSFQPGPPASLQKLRQIGPFWRAWQSLLKEDRKKPFDIVHAFWAAEPALLAVQVHRNMLKKPSLVVSVMGGEAVALPEINYGAYLHRLDRFYLNRAVHYADWVTAGSQTLATLLKNRYPTLKGRTVPVLPLGVDTEKFKPASPKSERKEIRIVAVGSLLPVKGHVNLIRAFAFVCNQRADLKLHLRIVGQGQYYVKLKTLIGELGLEKQIELAGLVSPEQMPEEYRKADLFALSSYYESQCVALCEALASGLPIVSSPVGLAAELLESGEAGELAANEQAEALANGLLRLLERRIEWPAMGKAARCLAEEKLSLKVCTNRFLALYKNNVNRTDAEDDITLKPI